MSVRRARGALLRLVRRRALAVAAGIALVAPAVWVEFFSRYEAWWIDGLTHGPASRFAGEFVDRQR